MARKPDSAFVAFLMGTGWTRSQAKRLAMAIDGLRIDGGSTEDLAGAILRHTQDCLRSVEEVEKGTDVMPVEKPTPAVVEFSTDPFSGQMVWRPGGGDERWI